MDLLGRKFIENGPQQAFLQGVANVLSKPLLNKIQLLRLSVKANKNGIDIVHSIWARPKRAPMRVFKRSVTLPFPNSTNKFQVEDWMEMGHLIGEEMQDWVKNDEEFDTQERKALSNQSNAWETSAAWDVAQDLIEGLEYSYGPHLHGKLHPVVRRGLSDLIVALIDDVYRDSAVRANTPKIPAKTRAKVSESAK